MKRIYLFGAGGHAKVICEILELQKEYKIAGFVEMNPRSKTFCGYPVYAQSEVTSSSDTYAIVAIGDNFLRSTVVQSIRKNHPDMQFATVVHPASVLSKDVRLGAGTVVMAQVVLNSGCDVGKHCILNTSTSIDHDCAIGDFASVAPGSVLGGNVQVGAFSAVGLGAKVIHGISIGTHTVIGAGSLVLENMSDSIVAFGIPAKEIRKRAAGEEYL